MPPDQDDSERLRTALVSAHEVHAEVMGQLCDRVQVVNPRLARTLEMTWKAVHKDHGRLGSLVSANADVRRRQRGAVTLSLQRAAAANRARLEAEADRDRAMEQWVKSQGERIALTE